MLGTLTRPWGLLTSCLLDTVQCRWISLAGAFSALYASIHLCPTQHVWRCDSLRAPGRGPSSLPQSPFPLVDADSARSCRAYRLRRRVVGPVSSNRPSFVSLLKLCSTTNRNGTMARIASFSGDLSSLTAPPFILSPISLTEFPGVSSVCPSYFQSHLL